MTTCLIRLVQVIAGTLSLRHFTGYEIEIAILVMSLLSLDHCLQITLMLEVTRNKKDTPNIFFL